MSNLTTGTELAWDHPGNGWRNKTGIDYYYDFKNYL